MGSVGIAAAHQSDYARNYAREGLEISDMSRAGCGAPAAPRFPTGGRLAAGLRP